MNKEQIIEFIEQYSPIYNGDYNEVVNDVKNRIIDSIDSYNDELSLDNIYHVEWDLYMDDWLIYDQDILDYYSKNRADIEDIIDATDVWQEMKYHPRASIFEAIKYAINSAHAVIIATIIGEITPLYA